MPFISSNSDLKFSPSQKIVITSFCFNDCISSLLRFSELSLNHNNVSLLVDSPRRYSFIIKLHSDLALSPHLLRYILVVPDFNRALLQYDVVFIFTLGTYAICRSVVCCLKSNIQVIYNDCYFPFPLSLSLRLNDPLHLLFSFKFSNRYYSPFTLLKQIFKQLFYDPLRTTYYFSYSHCWLTPRALTDVYIDSAKPNLTSVQQSVSLPPKSIIFIFCLFDDLTYLPDWAYWQHLGFDLFYKPHPTVHLNYPNYPSAVKTIAENSHIASLYLPSNSYIVGIASTSLWYHSNSISLYYLTKPTYDPLVLAYVSKISYQPKTLSDLHAILS